MKSLFLLSVLLMNALAQAMPISLKPGEMGSGRMYLPCSFDGHEETCLLDTGASLTSIQATAFARQYPAVGSHESGGASGTTVRCDVIQIGKVSVGGSGGFDLSDFQVNRCDALATNESTIGIDVFNGRAIKMDFQAKELSLVSSIPTGMEHLALTVGKRGQIAIPVQIDDLSSRAIFDTGAGLTSIDQRFVDLHPESFTFIQDGFSRDSVGEQVPFKLYRARKIRIGGYEFKDELMLAIDFRKFIDDLHESSDLVLIVGFNIITKANWYLDLQRNTWAIE